MSLDFFLGQDTIDKLIAIKRVMSTHLNVRCVKVGLTSLSYKNQFRLASDLEMAVFRIGKYLKPSQLIIVNQTDKPIDFSCIPVCFQELLIEYMKPINWAYREPDLEADEESPPICVRRLTFRSICQFKLLEDTIFELLNRVHPRDYLELDLAQANIEYI